MRLFSVACLVLLLAAPACHVQPARGVAGRQDEPSLLRGPYVQSVTKTTAVLCFWSPTAVSPRVVLFEGDATLSDSSYSSAVHHEIRLRGLKAGSRYRYRVTLAAFSVEGSFSTLPEDGREFVFVGYGDGRSNLKTHAKICRAIGEENPLFVLHSGDLVENGTRIKQWNGFFLSAAPYLRKCALFPSLGNHERDAKEYFDLFHLPGNERWYSFDVGPLHIIILDSNSRWRGKQEQLDWLRKDLASSRAPFKIAVFHHPLFSASLRKSRVRKTAKMYKLWGPIFEEGGLAMAIQGHNHNYQRAEKNGITYVTSGGGGAPLYPLGKNLPETKFKKVAHHYIRFRVSAEGIQGEAVDLKGEVIDTFRIQPSK